MATMVMTPQKRPPALETCFDPPFASVAGMVVYATHCGSSERGRLFGLA
jgi:hypothetical protein